MKPFVVFHNHGNHILDPLLKPGFRHCFAVISDGDYWITVDGHSGLPRIEVAAGTDYDLAAFYQEQGFTTACVKKRRPLFLPLVLSNCVGLVKAVLGIRCFAVTPYQLYKHLTGVPIMRLSLPGGGLFRSPKPPEAPPPPPLPPELPSEADESVKRVRRQSRKKASSFAGSKSTLLTGSRGLTAPAPTGKTSLLGQSGTF